MRRLLAVSAVFVFLVISCMKVEEIEGPVLSHGTVEEVEIASSDPMIGVKNAMVYLPPGYDSLDTVTTYPLIFLLHGYGWDYSFFQDLEDIADIADYMISTGEMRECILVMPDGKNSLGGSFYTDSPFGNYGTYITEEVLDFMKENYPVDTTKIGVLGISMGGYGALKLTVTHPDIFGAGASHSGPIAFPVFLEPDPLTGINVLGAMLLENPVYDSAGNVLGYRIPYPPLLDQEHPLTTMMFAMAGAFSPVVKAREDFDTLNYEFPIAQLPDGQWLGVILPIDTTAIPGDTVGLRQDVWEQWLANDVFTLIGQNYALLDSLNTGMYIDCGDEDEFFLQYHAMAVHDLLSNLGIDHYYEVFGQGPLYPPDRFPARHGTHLYLRLRESLKYISDHL